MTTYSAPAKVILFGEHAVVYGYPALAAPVSSLRATAQIEPLKTTSGLLIDAFDFTASVAILEQDENPDEPLTLLAHLVLKTLNAPPPNVRINLHSQIPIASGLGSGAAISTALGRAMAAALGTSLDNATLNQIIYEVEKLHHGRPSGIDNTVIVYETPIYFRRDHPVVFPHIGEAITLLIADTGQRAPTLVSVGDVRQLYESDHARIAPILAEIGDICLQARNAIETGNQEIIGKLMCKNHTLLKQLTVSSSVLDTLVDAALAAGALGAKMTGGGRGGNMIALVTDQTKISVADALQQAGAVRIFETVIG